nr:MULTISPECIES: hypothetical protein [unclassified Paenibacillus]
MMGSVFLDISMSLDGFIAGRGDEVERLHDWIVDFQTGIFKKSDVLNELFERTGAIVAGRRVYELTSGWGGNHPIRGVPVYVLSHDIPDNVSLKATLYLPLSRKALKLPYEKPRGLRAIKTYMCWAGRQWPSNASKRRSLTRFTCILPLYCSQKGFVCSIRLDLKASDLKRLGSWNLGG